MTRRKAVLGFFAVLFGGASLYAFDAQTSTVRDARVLDDNLQKWALFIPRSEAIKKPLIEGRYFGRWIQYPEPGRARSDRETLSTSGFLYGDRSTMQMFRLGEWRDGRGVPYWAEDFGWDAGSIRSTWVRLPMMYGRKSKTLKFRRYLPSHSTGFESVFEIPSNGEEPPAEQVTTIDLQGWRLVLEPRSAPGPGFRMTYEVRLAGGDPGAEYFVEFIPSRGQGASTAIGPGRTSYISMSRNNPTSNYVVEISRVQSETKKVTVQRLPGTEMFDFRGPGDEAICRLGVDRYGPKNLKLRMITDKFVTARIDGCWFGVPFEATGFPYRSDASLFSSFTSLKDGAVFEATVWKPLEVRHKVTTIGVPPLPEGLEGHF